MEREMKNSLVGPRLFHKVVKHYRLGRVFYVTIKFLLDNLYMVKFLPPGSTKSIVPPSIHPRNPDLGFLYNLSVLRKDFVKILRLKVILNIPLLYTLLKPMECTFQDQF